MSNKHNKSKLQKYIFNWTGDPQLQASPLPSEQKVTKGNDKLPKLGGLRGVGARVVDPQLTSSPLP